MALEFNESSILSDDEVVALFTDSDTEQQDDGTQKPSEKKSEDELNNKENPAEEEVVVDVEHLFDQTSESVGGQEDKQGKKDDAPSTKSVPPFSSLAKALKEEGVLLDLERNDLALRLLDQNVLSPDKYSEGMSAYIHMLERMAGNQTS